MLELSRPSLELFSSYMDCIQEMRMHGEKIWEETVPKEGESDQDFIQRLLQSETEPRPGLVPATTYWATLGDEVIGRIALRHILNSNLEEFGGHIGYEVRPSQRRKGYAKEILRKILLTDRAQEIGKLLLTCSPENTASNKTILANGGVLKKTAYLERIHRNTNYYWIELSGTGQ